MSLSRPSVDMSRSAFPPWRAQLEESIARYLSQLDTADRQEPTEALAAKVNKA
jgi:hypothetical protein